MTDREAILTMRCGEWLVGPDGFPMSKAFAAPIASGDRGFNNGEECRSRALSKPRIYRSPRCHAAWFADSSEPAQRPFMNVELYLLVLQLAPTELH